MFSSLPRVMMESLHCSWASWLYSTLTVLSHGIVRFFHSQHGVLIFCSFFQKSQKIFWKKEIVHLFLLLLFFFPCFSEWKIKIRESNQGWAKMHFHGEVRVILQETFSVKSPTESLDSSIHYSVPVAASSERALRRCRRALCRRWQCGRRRTCRPWWGCGRARSWKAEARYPRGRLAD